MPNAKVLEAKKATVSALSEQIKSATAGVFVDYKGITVDQDTKLRNDFREAGVSYSVVKNTLTRLAARECGYDFDELLNNLNTPKVGFQYVKQIHNDWTDLDVINAIIKSR